MARIKACNASTIKVVGYTDTSGSPKYNLPLSQKRAQVVVDALTQAGLPGAIISAERTSDTSTDAPSIVRRVASFPAPPESARGNAASRASPAMG